MSTTDTRAQVLDILLDVVPDIEPDQMAPEASFREAFNVDSMDFIDILERVSATFGVEIPEDDYAKVESLDGLTGYIDAHRS